MTAVVPSENGLAMLAELEREGAISVIGLHLTDPNLPYGKFEALCGLLGKMNQAVKFAIGDAIILGERLYGEKAYQAFERLELSEKGMMEYVRVSARVPRSRRRKDLSWSHHRAVAALEPTEQRQWLKEASEKGLNHAALRDALRIGQVEQNSTPQSCRCCGRAFDAAS